jgi:hypothetical protein
LALDVRVVAWALDFVSAQSDSPRMGTRGAAGGPMGDRRPPVCPRPSAAAHSPTWTGCKQTGGADNVHANSSRGTIP